MKRVLLTGATGYIGGQLARKLAASGYEVDALVRSPGAAAPLADLGIRLVQGDITDPESLRAAMRDKDGVLHLAAVYTFGSKEDVMRAVNVEGTRNVLDCAGELQVPRVLYCGSDTSLGDTRGNLVDEEYRSDSEPRSSYERTKREAHDLVEARMAAGAPVVNAVVSTVYGPMDPSAVGDMIRDHLAGRLPFLLDPAAGYTFAHVEDVAEGLKRAYEEGVPGERYLVSGEPASFGDLFRHIADLTGRTVPPVLPSWVRVRLSWLLVLLGWATGRPPAVTRELFAMGTGVTRYFDAKKAREELGFRTRGLREGLASSLPRLSAEARALTEGRLTAARPLILLLALFDLGLAALVLFFPHLYLDLMHPGGLVGAGPLLYRTGMLWAFFCAVQVYAFVVPTPLRVMAVATLRLLDVLADPLYGFLSGDTGRFGHIMLFVVSPLTNLGAGLYLGTLALQWFHAARAGSVAVLARSTPPESPEEVTDR